MNTLLVGYDLNRPLQDYPRLLAYLRSGGTWWHHLDSTWLVVTTFTATQLRDALLPLIDANDELLVIDVTGRPRAWRGFDQRGSAWLSHTFR